MNTVTNIEAQALASAFVSQNPFRHPQRTAHDVCNVLRDFARRPASHDDWVLILANLAAAVQKPCAMNDKCTQLVVDGLDEIIGRIEQDKKDQQAEQMWDDKQEAA